MHHGLANIPQETSGVLIADRPGKVTTYASLGMVDRGELYLEVGTEAYKRYDFRKEIDQVI